MKIKSKRRLLCILFVFLSCAIVIVSIICYSFPPKYADAETSKRIIAIGGFNEIVIPELNRALSATLKEDCYSFFQWYQTDYICSYLEKNAGEIILIGHSYGGATAVEIANKYKDRVVLLVTLDPVSRKKSSTIEDTKWINVIATEKDRSWNGTIAMIGGKWGDCSKATNYSIPCNHADAKTMLLADNDQHETVWDEIISAIDKDMLKPYPAIFDLTKDELSEYFLNTPEAMKENCHFYLSMSNAAFLYYFSCFLEYFQSSTSMGDYISLLCFVGITEQRLIHFPKVFQDNQQLVLDTLDYCLENYQKFDPQCNTETQNRIKKIKTMVVNPL